MVKLSRSIRPSNNTSAPTATTSKTTGPSCFLWLSSPTTMHLARLLVCPLSLLTKDTTQTLQFTLSRIWPPTALKNMLSIWGNSTNTSRLRWPKHSSDSRKLQMLVACHRLTSPSVNVPMSKNTISALEDLPRKYLGPYDLIVQVGTHSFTLKLPDALRSVH